MTKRVTVRKTDLQNCATVAAETGATIMIERDGFIIHVQPPKVSPVECPANAGKDRKRPVL